jgi:tRNA (guanine37-N1)-methyltransferase
MKISILTLFPEMFTGPFDYSILNRAKANDLIDIQIINIRDYAEDKYKTVDGKPYGGGVGMIMRVDIIDKAISSALDISRLSRKDTRIILTSAKGSLFNQKKAEYLSKYKHLILIAGHYEGIDERVLDIVDEEISVGDYILTGGELPVMAITDSIVRLLPGVLKNESAIITESFTNPNLLEYPQYTKPQIYKKLRVPPELLSGNHALISKWKEKAAKKITKKNRPDLIK